MRHTPHAESKSEKRTLLAATFACYLLGLACVLGMTYSLAALAAPSLAADARAAVELQARP